MHAISQIIERNLGRRMDCGAALWINPERDDSWQSALGICNSLTLFCHDFGTCTFLQQSGVKAGFSAFPTANTERYDWIILNLPRQKALLGMMLDCAADLLADEGVLWLAGENKAGIKSADKSLKRYFGQVRKLDNARHCTLFEAGNALKKPPFNHLIYRQVWPLGCGPADINIITYPGVFAHGRLDAGTALLIETLSTMKLEGEILDFACGAGLVGACVAKTNPHARISMLDNNALALRACEETLAENHLNGTLIASDGLSNVQGSFDFIISNPPIHAGVKTDARLSMRLLEPVCDHIHPGGTLIIVANLHLPYENWLSQKFSRCNQLAANANFKVILARA